MPLKLLALIPELGSVDATLDVAEAAARPLEDASVEALHVCVDPRSLRASPEEVDIALLQEVWEGTARERADAVKAAFEAWRAAHPGAPVGPVWKEVKGSEQGEIVREAQRFDALVVPAASSSDGVEALHAAVYRVRKPFFYAPAGWSDGVRERLAERIVIAWSDTEACRRAVVGAMPWLARASEVIAVLVAENQDAGKALDGLLFGHDVAHRTVSVARDAEPLGEQILDICHQNGASMLVMGAHGHSLFIEWLMGHTTESVMQNSDLPLLLAH